MTDALEKCFGCTGVIKVWQCMPLGFSGKNCMMLAQGEAAVNARGATQLFFQGEVFFGLVENVGSDVLQAWSRPSPPLPGLRALALFRGHSSRSRVSFCLR